MLLMSFAHLMTHSSPTLHHNIYSNASSYVPSSSLPLLPPPITSSSDLRSQNISSSTPHNPISHPVPPHTQSSNESICMAHIYQYCSSKIKSKHNTDDLQGMSCNHDILLSFSASHARLSRRHTSITDRLTYILSLCSLSIISSRLQESQGNTRWARCHTSSSTYTIVVPGIRNSVEMIGVLSRGALEALF